MMSRMGRSATAPRRLRRGSGKSCRFTMTKMRSQTVRLPGAGLENETGTPPPTILITPRAGRPSLQHDIKRPDSTTGIIPMATMMGISP